MVGRRAHLCQHVVKPLESTFQMDFDPTGRGSDILSMIIGTPTLDKGYPESQ